ncbi:hypothetical protein ACTVZO_17735 [Streptomyces sp. IBSNAI002]|uniref:hypothetical protein n=1 Tax=Streptomyces sp. IBSNAI002 TaxID=3457500 RepID=UPI003FD67D31
MRTHHTAALATAAAILALTACNPQTTDTGQPAPAAPSVAPTSAPAAPTTSAAPAPAPTSSAPAAPAESAVVPNAVGQILQAAQDNAQAAGFFLLGSTDALGQSRMQVLDRNWKVCSQTPAAGTKAPTSTKLIFNSVKLEESCP